MKVKLGLVLMEGVIFSKSVIQFSVDGWSCVPSLLLTWGQTIVEVMLMGPPSKDPMQYCYTYCPKPCSRPRLTHTSIRDSWTLPGKSGSVSCGVTALLGPGAQSSVCALQESISQSCVSSGSPMVGLMVTSSKRAYATPRSASSRVHVSVAVHC